jgi:hypothetical protein
VVAGGQADRHLDRLTRSRRYLIQLLRIHRNCPQARIGTNTDLSFALPVPPAELWEWIMRNARMAQLACEKCCSPMDLLEDVPVLQSLQDHAVFACEWCGHVALVRRQNEPASPCWIGSLPPDCRVSYAAL